MKCSAIICKGVTVCSIFLLVSVVYLVAVITGLNVVDGLAAMKYQHIITTAIIEELYGNSTRQAMSSHGRNAVNRLMIFQFGAILADTAAYTWSMLLVCQGVIWTSSKITTLWFRGQLVVLVGELIPPLLMAFHGEELLEIVKLATDIEFDSSLSSFQLCYEIFSCLEMFASRDSLRCTVNGFRFQIWLNYAITITGMVAWLIVAMGKLQRIVLRWKNSPGTRKTNQPRMNNVTDQCPSMTTETDNQQRENAPVTNGDEMQRQDQAAANDGEETHSGHQLRDSELIFQMMDLGHYKRCFSRRRAVGDHASSHDLPHQKGSSRADAELHAQRPCLVGPYSVSEIYQTNDPLDTLV